MRFAYLAVPALLALSACAALQNQEASDSEVLLTQAGFKSRAADGPQLAAMPARQIVERSENGNAVYTFADPGKCGCVYVGEEQEYSRLQRLRQQRIDDHTQLTRQS